MNRLLIIVILSVFMFSCENTERENMLSETLKYNNKLVLFKIHESASDINDVVENNGNKPSESAVLGLAYNTVQVNNAILSNVVSDKPDENLIRSLTDSLNKIKEAVFKDASIDKTSGPEQLEHVYRSMNLFFENNNSLNAEQFINQSSYTTIFILNELATQLNAPFMFNFCSFEFSYEIDSISPEIYTYTIVVNPSSHYSLPSNSVEYQDPELDLETEDINIKTVGNTFIVSFNAKSSKRFKFNCLVKPKLFDAPEVNNIINSGCQISFRSDTVKN